MKRCSLIRVLLKILDHLVSMRQLLKNQDLMFHRGLIKQLKTNLLKLYHKILEELLCQCQALLWARAN